MNRRDSSPVGGESDAADPRAPRHSSVEEPAQSEPAAHPVTQYASAEQTDAQQSTSGEEGAAQPSKKGEPPAPNRAVGTIEVPPANQQLDAALVAEIDAAMATSELSESTPVASSAVETDEEHGEKPPEETLEKGQHLAGRIQSIHGDGVLLDLGYRSAGLVPLRQFVSGKKPEVGQRIEVLVDRLAPDEGLIYLNLPKGLRRIAGNWDQLSKGRSSSASSTARTRAGWK